MTLALLYRSAHGPRARMCRGTVAGRWLAKFLVIVPVILEKRRGWGRDNVTLVGPMVCTGPCVAAPGGLLQPVLMRPTPQLSFKTWGGGQLGGGGGGGSSRGSGGGGCLPGVRGGGGLAGGQGGVQPGVRGGGGFRVRVKVTELVEPVLVL